MFAGEGERTTGRAGRSARSWATGVAFFLENKSERSDNANTKMIITAATAISISQIR